MVTFQVTGGKHKTHRVNSEANASTGSETPEKANKLQLTYRKKMKQTRRES